MATQAQEAQSAVGSNNSRTGIIQDEEDPKPKPTEYELTYPTNHLFVLSPKNPFRRLCVKIGTSKVFVTLFLYSVNSTKLCSNLTSHFCIFSYIFTAV